MHKTLTIPSAEPFFLPGGKTGCLLIHGFTGTPKEMRMLGDSLNEEGYSVLAPRLFGHATNPLDMQRAQWQDWCASVEDGLNLLRGCTEKQVVMGLSMGGILSLIAAARFDIAGVVLFSTPCDLPDDPRRKFLPLLHHIYPRLEKGKSDWHNAEAEKDHVDYPYYPTRSIMELSKLIQVMRSELVDIQVPAFFVQSRADHGIPENSLDVLFDGISSSDKHKLWVENSGHVIIREPEREEIFLAVKLFMKRILPST